MTANGAALTLHFSPLIGESGLQLFGIIILALFVLSFAFYRKALLWRTACAATFIAFLLNPSLVEEEYEPVTDVAVIVADRSQSQENGQRTERMDKALLALTEKMEKQQGLDIRVIDAPSSSSSLKKETRLFDALEQALADVPDSRRAGVVFLTDGQVHDVPSNIENTGDYGPVHALLTGDKDEKDRRIVISEAPAYGIVGQTVTIRYRIEDTSNTGENYATLMVRENDKTPKIDLVPVNEEHEMDITISHAGQNIIDLESSPVDDEITTANNRTQLLVNGVRDRLRVLLVSGKPHAGGRAWRNILTADPGVDLVHFTILREPDKLDATPQNELSLIAFPFRELFEIKLYDFDLIIFDRYRLNRILPNYYFSNIARYVREGGALLEASGPSFAGTDSIYTTALNEVLPARPTGQVMETTFTPALTTTGNRHPVTQNLTWANGTADKPWGAWLRQIAVVPKEGEVLMTGTKQNPLLILNRIEEGRVAQISSDHLWLWARGFDGGGPQAELLRRLVHWLMKEPDLEENALVLHTENDDTLIIRRRALQDMDIEATVTAPSSTQTKIKLAPAEEGWLEAKMNVTEQGVYNVYDGTQSRFVIVGPPNPPELKGVKTTADILAPLVEKSNGNILWLADTPEPKIRFLPPGRHYAGKDWVGLRENNARNITGTKDTPLLPEWAYAFLMLCVLITSWGMEGRAGRSQNRQQ